MPASSILTNMAAEAAAARTQAAVVETSAVSWLKNHERIVITSLVLLVGTFGINKYLNVTADHDKLVANQAAQTLKAQEDKDTTLAQVVAAQQQQYATLVQQLTQQNSALSASMQNRTTVLQVQQKSDAALPMPDLGARLTQLAGLQATDVSSAPSGITLSPNASYKVTESLEQVPVLQANLSDSQTQTQNLTKELTAANSLSATKDEQIVSLKQTVTDTQVVGDKNLTACKATARRGKLHSFFYGVGVGVGATTAFVIHALL